MRTTERFRGCLLGLAVGDAVGTTIRIHRYDDLIAGESDLRDGGIDVLVVDDRLLEWRRRADEQLKAITTSAIHLVGIQARARDAGIAPDETMSLESDHLRLSDVSNFST